MAKYGVALVVLLAILPTLMAADPCAGKKNGALVASGRCSAEYYQCWQGQPVSPNPKCNAPLVFNARANPQGCSYAGAIGTRCPCSAFYTGDDLKACNVCKRKQKLGNFAMPGKPNMYVQCTVQKAFPAYCNAGLVWCPRKRNCVSKC